MKSQHEILKKALSIRLSIDKLREQQRKEIGFPSYTKLQDKIISKRQQLKLLYWVLNM